MAYSVAALGLLGVVIVIGLRGDDDLRISKEIVLDDGRLFSDPLAVAAVGNDVYVIAGKSRSGEGALGFRLLRDAKRAEVLWRYSGEKSQELAKVSPNLPFGGDAFAPDFRGVAGMSDGSIFLCGYGPRGAVGRHRPGLLTHLDSFGAVIKERALLPTQFVDPPRNHSLDPNNLGEVVQSGFDACVPWGNNVGFVGRALHLYPSQNDPRIRDRKFYYWIMVCNSIGEIVWQKLISSPFGSTSVAGLTSVLVTPERNLMFTYDLSGRSELLSVSEAGLLVGARQFEEPLIAVHSSAKVAAVQVFGGGVNATKSVITLDEGLREVHREDGLSVPYFFTERAFGHSGSYLLLIGQQVRSSRDGSAVRYLSASRQLTARTLSRGSLSDSGTAKLVTPTGRADEFLLVRTLHQKTPDGGTRRAGIALDLISAIGN